LAPAGFDAEPPGLDSRWPKSGDVSDRILGVLISQGQPPDLRMLAGGTKTARAGFVFIGFEFRDRAGPSGLDAP
jgi:hypothetical protein